MAQHKLAVAQHKLAVAQKTLAVTQKTLAVTQKTLAVTQKTSQWHRRHVAMAQHKLAVAQKTLAVTQKTQHSFLFVRLLNYYSLSRQHCSKIYFILWWYPLQTFLVKFHVC